MRAPPVAVPWYGGKSKLARRIIAGFISHRKYVETHAGSLGVLLSKPLAAVELANDLDGPLINLYRVLTASTIPFCSFLHALPYSRETYDRAALWRDSDDPFYRAAGFLCRNRMSFSSSGRTFMIDRMGDNGSGWLPFVSRLAETARRLRAVRFSTLDAAEVLRDHDAPDTVFYVDPPYLESARSPDRHYAHEMTAADHERLLKTILGCVGSVYLSGYRSELYDDYLRGWQRVEWTVTAAMSLDAGQGRARTECLWATGRAGYTMSMNY